jgi:hypothetical protein
VERSRWIYDIGFFLYLAWPIVMPYYLLKSRGAKGILAVLAFIGVYVGATVLGIVLYLLVAPEGWPTAAGADAELALAPDGSIAALANNSLTPIFS